MEKLIIITNKQYFEATPILSVPDIIIEGSSTADALFLEGNSITGASFIDGMYVRFKKVSGSTGSEYNSDLNNLKTSFINCGDEGFTIPYLDGQNSYNYSLLGSLSMSEERILQTARFVKSIGYKPVVYGTGISNTLIYILANEKITYTDFRENDL